MTEIRKEKKLEYVVSDLTTQIELFASFANTITEKIFSQAFLTNCKIIFQVVNFFFHFYNKNKLYILSDKFELLGAQMLTTLRAFMSWFQKANQHLIERKAFEETLKISLFFTSNFFLLNNENSNSNVLKKINVAPFLILKSASKTLFSFASHFYRLELLCPTFTHLLAHCSSFFGAPSSSLSLPLSSASFSSIKSSFFSALDCFFLSHSCNENEPKSNPNSLKLLYSPFVSFVEPLQSSSLLALFNSNNPTEEEQRERCREVVRVLRKGVEEVREHSLHSKQIVYQLVLKSFLSLFNLFPLFVQLACPSQGNELNNKAIGMSEEIVLFFVDCFQSLSQLFGCSNIVNCLNSLLSPLHSLISKLSLKSSPLSKLFLSLFKLFDFFAESNSSEFRVLFVNIFNFLSQIFPFISSEEHLVELKNHFFIVLYHLLLNHLKTLENTLFKNEKLCVSILHYFTKSVVESEKDLEMMRENISRIVQLNQKLLLFSKDYFKQHIYSDFTSSILKLLSNKTRNIAKEELIELLYHIAKIDFPVFFKFVGEYFIRRESFDTAFKQYLWNEYCINTSRFTDMPSFKRCISDFVDDLSLQN